MEIVRCYQEFMLRLADAVSEQDRRVEQTRQATERCRELLIERRESHRCGQLIERRQQEAALIQRRQEQKSHR